MNPPIPVWVVTGALGAGKTTAIARLMASKPPAENWIVILNEFTESGIDALTVAGAAQGAFDVRLVPGGCLCCAGEMDFARQLRELTRVTRPDRLIIEPSGIGHPAAITEELLQHQQYGSLTVESIVCLIEPQSIAELLVADESVNRAQVEVADVLVLSKSDRASADERSAFERLAESLYPPKRWSGVMSEGLLPAEALQAAGSRVLVRAPARTPAHEHGHAHDHEAAPAVPRPVQIGPFSGERHERHAVGRTALAWTLDREAVFARTRLLAALAAEGSEAPLMGVERFKGVFRTGPETWLLVQRTLEGCSAQESSWRRDSRAEALFAEHAPIDAERLERALEHALARPLQ